MNESYIFFGVHFSVYLKYLFSQYNDNFVGFSNTEKL